MKKNLPPNRHLIKIAMFIYKAQRKIRNIEFIYDTSEIADLEPPFVIVANHGAHIDTLLLYDVFFEKHSFYILGAANLLSSPLKKQFFKRIGVISKLQCQKDIKAIREAIRVTKNGYPLAVFPSGRLPSAGKGKLVDESFSKFLKILDIPVVSFNIAGSSLIKPKWAKNYRKGIVSVKTSLLYTKSSLEEDSLETIKENVNSTCLRYNDYNRNMILKRTYKGKNKAVGLENILYICPKCKKKYTTFSKDNTINCSCGFSLSINDFGMFCKNNYFRHVEDYFSYIESLVREETKAINYKLESDVHLKLLEKKHGKRKLNGKICLDKSGLRYQGTYLNGKDSFFIPINHLKSLPYTTNKSFEVVVDNKIVNVIPINKRSVVEFSLAAEALARKEEKSGT